MSFNNSLGSLVLCGAFAGRIPIPAFAEDVALPYVQNPQPPYA
jgi:hypothetical protein